MIEKKKWDYLADIRARTGAKTLYINSTPHGVYQFDLGALIEPEWALLLKSVVIGRLFKTHSGSIRAPKSNW